MQPFKSASDSLPPISCMQLTDRHIYFTWVDELRRPNIPLFQDAEDAQELAPPIIQDVIGEFEGPPIAPTLDEEFQLWVAQRGGCQCSFTKLMQLDADSVTMFLRKARSWAGLERSP